MDDAKIARLGTVGALVVVATTLLGCEEVQEACDLGAVAALRVAECAPAELAAVPGLIAGSTGQLQASLTAATDLGSTVGLQ
ncbi:MAG: hypothetical protein PVI30_13855 [Myxococcales bacterium]|jgi:hypothetical protein